MRAIGCKSVSLATNFLTFWLVDRDFVLLLISSVAVVVIFDHREDHVRFLSVVIF